MTDLNFSHFLFYSGFIGIIRIREYRSVERADEILTAQISHICFEPAINDKFSNVALRSAT